MRRRRQGYTVENKYPTEVRAPVSQYAAIMEKTIRQNIRRPASTGYRVAGPGRPQFLFSRFNRSGARRVRPKKTILQRSSAPPRNMFRNTVRIIKEAKGRNQMTRVLFSRHKPYRSLHKNGVEQQLM